MFQYNPETKCQNTVCRIKSTMRFKNFFDWCLSLLWKTASDPHNMCLQEKKWIANSMYTHQKGYCRGFEEQGHNFRTAAVGSFSMKMPLLFITLKRHSCCISCANWHCSNLKWTLPSNEYCRIKGHQKPLNAFNDCFVYGLEKCKKCATVKRDYIGKWNNFLLTSFHFMCYLF